MIEHIEEILLTEPDGSEIGVRMKFKDGIAIQVDEDGDVPLFEDPIILTYPSAQDVADSNELASDIELYTGRPFDVHESCYFDIALVYGIRHNLSEIVKRKRNE